jgi:hypothetical protein
MRLKPDENVENNLEEQHIIKLWLQSHALVMIHQAMNAKESILVLKRRYEDFWSLKDDLKKGE